MNLILLPMQKANFNRFRLFTIITIIFLGLIHLPIPFSGDQAFFLLGAKEMNDGLILYRDFWDIKQPGIFYFYYIAAKLFGFNVIGVRVFELIYWLFFFVCCQYFLSRYIYKNKPLSALIASATIVVCYYGLSYYVLLTQVEIIVNFPLILIVFFNHKFLTSNKKNYLWLLFSGFCFGIILLFKLIFLPIVLCFYILFLIFWTQQYDFKITKLWSTFIIALGLIISILPFMIYCYNHDILNLCYSTFFEFPIKILHNGFEKNINFLWSSNFNFFKKMPFFLPFALLGMLKIKRNDYFHLSMITWFFAGLIVIYLQKTSWYQYHLYLLYTPFIMLTVHGVEHLLDNYKKLPFIQFFKTKYLYVLTFYIFLNLPTFFYVLLKVYKLSNYSFCFTRKAYISYILDNEENKEAYLIAQNLKQVDPLAKNPIFVVNNPLVYYYTGLNQAISQSGWSLQLFISGQYNLLLSELKIKKPEYILVYNKFIPVLEDNCPNVLDWIKKNYTKKTENEFGIWFKINTIHENNLSHKL